MYLLQNLPFYAYVALMLQEERRQRREAESLLTEALHGHQVCPNLISTSILGCKLIAWGFLWVLQ